VLFGFPSECIDLVVTSPPYDDLRTYGGHSWDFEGVARELTRVLKPGGVIVWVVADATVNGSETLTSMKQAIHFKDVCGLNVWDTMVYQKSVCPFPDANRYYQGWEYMIVLSKGSPKTFQALKDRANRSAGRKVTGTEREKTGGTRQKACLGNEIKAEGVRFNVWLIEDGSRQGDHPAPFPHALASDHIQSWSNPGDVVLDPFAGSGTTLKAAKELNRRFIGIEINPEYVAICKRRIAQDVLPLFSANAIGEARADNATPPKPPTQ
jgi:DNA modification methylase